MSRSWIPFVSLLFATFALADDVLHLDVGPADRRDRTVPVVLDAVTDAVTGELLTPDQLPARLAGVRLLFIGESHTDMDFHRLQLRTLEELARAGRRVLVGLEMYPYTEQQTLDRWVAGELDEEGFLEASAWYDNWGYRWDYYRGIFNAAQRGGWPMYALNTPREVVRAVREKGFAELTEEEAEHIPTEIDVDSPEHLRLFKAFFDEDDSFHASMTEEQWQGMFHAQCTWDATMGHNAVRALERHAEEEGAILVVLVGSGHVAYGLGIQRQAAQWFDGGMAALIPVAVRDEEGEPVETVQASYAEFVWGVPPETYTLYPSLGLSTRETEDESRRRVIHVAEDSAAARAGLEVGDVLLAIDGAEVRTREELNRWVAGKEWGDRGTLRVQRGEERLELPVFFRREVEE